MSLKKSDISLRVSRHQTLKAGFFLDQSIKMTLDSSLRDY